MNPAILQLTESAFQDILNFVVTSGRLSERKPFYDSLRHLGSTVLKLDDMVIGRCSGSEPESKQRCSTFDPMVSLLETSSPPSSSPCSPGSGAGCTSGGQSTATKPETDFEVSAHPSSRVVVCHRRKMEAPPVCLITSTTQRSGEELNALLSTLFPYVCEAMERLDAERPKKCASASQARESDGELPACLTNREQEVLQWTAKGKGCWEIGHIVGISERTVKFHLQNIYRKLNVVNRAQAVAIAAENKLLTQ